MSELIVLDEVSPAEIFQGEGLNELLERIRVEASSFVPDVSSAKGRKEVASMAMKVSKCKTYLDGKGKDIVDALKKQPKLIDAKRKELRDFLDDLKNNVRDPLTRWEDADKERIAAHSQALLAIIATGEQARDDWHSMGLDALVNHLETINTQDMGASWDEFEHEALEAREDAIAHLKKAIEQKEVYISEQAELEKLRSDAVERDQKEAARIAAEEALKLEKERLEKEEKRIKDEAEAKARKIVEQAERDKQDAIEAKERAEQQTKDAEAKAAREIEEKQQREQAEIAMREADTKHRGKINREAMAALVESGVDKDEAKKVITVIAKGMIPNVKINY